MVLKARKVLNRAAAQVAKLAAAIVFVSALAVTAVLAVTISITEVPLAGNTPGAHFNAEHEDGSTKSDVLLDGSLETLQHGTQVTDSAETHDGNDVEASFVNYQPADVDWEVEVIFWVRTGYKTPNYHNPNDGTGYHINFDVIVSNSDMSAGGTWPELDVSEYMDADIQNEDNSPFAWAHGDAKVNVQKQKSTPNEVEFRYEMTSDVEAGISRGDMQLEILSKRISLSPLGYVTAIDAGTGDEIQTWDVD